MAIEWVTAGKVAAAAAQAFWSYLQGRKDAAERDRNRDLMIQAINQARDDILDRMNAIERAILSGELEGFQVIYASYNPDPNDPLEEERLVNIADDSARVLGRLGSHLDNVPSNPDLAFDVWAIYVPLLYLRAQALAERQAVYGADQATEAILSFDLAIPRLNGLLSRLRARSDAGFGPIVCKPMPDSQDARVCWYRWIHGNVSEQFICGSTRDPRGIEKCKASRASNMDTAYRNTPGVRQITAAVEQLQISRDALETIDTLDILGTHGVLVGELKVVNGHFALADEPVRLENHGRGGAQPKLVPVDDLTTPPVDV